MTRDAMVYYGMLLHNMPIPLSEGWDSCYTPDPEVGILVITPIAPTPSLTPPHAVLWFGML
eukprot:6613843-Pyramimonas_sp.AAC.1